MSVLHEHETVHVQQETNSWKHSCCKLTDYLEVLWDSKIDQEAERNWINSVTLDSEWGKEGCVRNKTSFLNLKCGNPVGAAGFWTGWLTESPPPSTQWKTVVKNYVSWCDTDHNFAITVVLDNWCSAPSPTHNKKFRAVSLIMISWNDAEHKFVLIYTAKWWSTWCQVSPLSSSQWCLNMATFFRVDQLHLAIFCRK